MKLKVFKPVVAICMALLFAGTSFAQDDVTVKPVEPVAPVAVPVISTDVIVEPLTAPVSLNTPVSLTAPVSLNSSQPLVANVNVTTHLKAELHKITVQMKNISVKTNAQVVTAVKNVSANITANVVDVAPQINLAFKDGDDISYTDNVQDGNELTKNYSKTYPVDANDMLVIDNRYGNITVNTWARNEIKVDVQIRVGSGNGDEAQKMLDNVSISDAKNGNSVAFKTNINEIKSSWMSMFNGNKGNHHVEINYIVYMPAKNGLVIANRYGGITLPDMDGSVTLNCAYGNIAARSLNSQSAIQLKYGNANIGNTGTCAIDLSYGNLTMDGANKLMANVSYSGVRIGKIREEGSINIRYGDGLQIQDIDKNMRSLAINTSYTNVNLGLSGDENVNFDVTVHYGDFNYGDHPVIINVKSPPDGARGSHTTQSYKGVIGKGNPDGKNIAINASYGNVKFD